MRYAQILLVATAWPCMGTTPAPFAFECSVLDRVSDAAKAGLPSRSIAIEILERVGEARMDIPTTDLEARVGLKPGQLHGREFKDSTVRAHALRKIGELFCEGRMGVVSRNPDQLKALGSFLSVSGGFTDLDLIGWAISKLEAMKSPRADAELERYAKEIDALPEDSTLKRELESKRAHLRIVLPHPPK